MATMKVYTLGNHGFISAEVRDALGLPPHTRQARVLIAEETKAAAIRAVEAARSRRAAISLPTRSDPEFRVATGNDVDALRAAGLLDGPRVLVVGSVASGSPVVQVGEYTVRRIGVLVRDGAGARFVAEEG